MEVFTEKKKKIILEIKKIRSLSYFVGLNILKMNKK